MTLTRIIPLVFLFALALPAHAETDIRANIVSILERILAIQTNMLAQVTATQAPDFAAINFTRSPSGSIAVGQEVSFTGQVRNSGGQHGWLDAAQMCMNNPTCVNNVGIYYSVPVLNAGGTYTLPIPWTWTATAGTHTATLCAPRPSTDVNGANNCTSLTFTVGGANTQPTMQTDTNLNAQTNTQTNTSTSAQQQTQVTTQTNTTTQTNATVTGVVWGPQSNTPFNGPKSTTNFQNAGQCFAWTTIECNGTYPTNRGSCALGLRYSTDYREVSCAGSSSGQTQTQTNTTNSQTQQTQTNTTILPDLNSSISSSAQGQSVTEGTTISFEGVVYNSQSAATASSKARFCMDNANCSSSTTGRIGGDQSVSAFQSNGSYTLSNVSWIATGANRNHTLYLCVDIEKRISESLESNNCSSLTFWVTPSPVETTRNIQEEGVAQTSTQTQNTTTQTPQIQNTSANADLMISGAGPLDRRYTVNSGDVVTLIAYPRSLEQPTAETQVRICLGNSECLTSTNGQLSQQTVRSLVNNPSALVSIAWTAITGDHKFYFCIDVTKTTAELDENNNCTRVDIKVNGSTTVTSVIPVPQRPNPLQQNSVIEIGMTTPFDWNPSTGSYGPANNDPKNLNYNQFIRNLDRLQGKVDWVRIHAWAWMLLDPHQFNGDDSPKDPNGLIQNPQFWPEGIQTIKNAIREAQNRGFKVQISNVEPDFRVTSYLNSSGQYFYSQQQLETHYRKFMARLANEFPTVDSWPLFNESNQFPFRPVLEGYEVARGWNGNIIDDDAEYLKNMSSLLAIGKEEVKKVNPNAIIISSPFAPWRMYENPHASQQNRRRLKQYFDAVSPHVDMLAINFYLSDFGHLFDESKIAFELKQLEDNVEFLRTTYGDRPIFIGEFGIPVCRGATEQQQVMWYDALLRKMQELGVKKIMLYTMQDDIKFSLGLGECDYSFGFIDKDARDRLSLSQTVGGVVQDLRNGITRGGATTHDGAGVCLATIDAAGGSVSSNLVEKRVGSRNQCLSHCAATIQPSNLSNWRSDGWNMCWYDNGSERGFIRGEVSVSDFDTDTYVPTPNEKHLCQVTVNAALGSQKGNILVRSVAHRAQCIDFCAAHIQPSNLNNWRNDGWSMCWYDDGNFQGSISSAETTPAWLSHLGRPRQMTFKEIPAMVSRALGLR